MKSRIPSIVNRLIILCIAVLVCLPCTAKRVVKQALDIPVIAVAAYDKINKTLSCPAFTHINNRETTGKAGQKDIDKKDGLVSPLLRTATLTDERCFVTCIPAVSAVPLYIRHQQYLI
jgi:hypothetical protein